jgi:hypothetical protein
VLPVCISHDHAGINRKSFTANQALGHAAPYNRLEQLARRTPSAAPMQMTVEEFVSHAYLDSADLSGLSGARNPPRNCPGVGRRVEGFGESLLSGGESRPHCYLPAT